MRQGEVGDCYFLSALDGLARARPGEVSALIRNAGNAYEVRFYRRSAVSVSGTEVRHGVGADGVWARILESAWEKSRGNIRADGTVEEQGGDPSEAIRALTGNRSRTIELRPGNADHVLATMRDSLARGGIAVAATRARHPGIAPEHAYTVLQVDERGNVVLRNPWKSGPYPRPTPEGYKPNPMGPGTFAVDPATFTRNFPDVYLEVNAKQGR